MRERGRNSRRRDVPSVRRHIIFGVIVCVLVVLLVLALWHLTRLHAFTIAHVSIRGGETIPHTIVQNTVDGVLQGSYMKIIPYRFSFLYPQDRIVDAVTALSKVKESEVVREGTTLTVTFSEYIPFALWCLPLNDIQCYYLDETGYAFAPGPRLEGGALVRHTVEREVELGRRQVFETEALTHTHTFLKRLEREAGMRVTDVVYTNEGDLILRLGGGGELRLRNDDAYDTVYANLETILASDEFKHLEPGNFWYIDLRFGNKVFVNEEIPVLDTGTTTASTSESSL